MNKTRNKKRLFYLVLLLACILPANMAAASMISCLTTDQEWGNSTPAVSFRLTAKNDSWASIFQSAITNWNESDAKVDLTITSTASNKMESGKYGQTWYGQCAREGKDRFSIKVNQETISQDAKDLEKFALSTTVHELGHILCLNDLYNASLPTLSIMNYARNRNTLYKPTYSDVITVNSVYYR